MKNIILKTVFILLLLTAFSCSDSECAYDESEFDCPQLELNVGDPCSVLNDGNINGNINEFCECIPG